MSENTQSAKCTQEEWDLARAAGLLVTTTSEEVALHKFAELIRATPPAAPAATEAPSDWRARVADLILHLHQWQAAPVGNESTAAWDRLQGTINALATPAPAVGAIVQPVLASLSDEQPMSLIDAIHALDIHNRSAKQMAVRISQNPGLLIEALRGLS